MHALQVPWVTSGLDSVMLLALFPVFQGNPVPVQGRALIISQERIRNAELCLM